MLEMILPILWVTRFTVRVVVHVLVAGVTMLCDAPCVRDLSTLFGLKNKASDFTQLMDSHTLKHGVRTNSAFFALIFL